MGPQWAPAFWNSVAWDTVSNFNFEWKYMGNEWFLWGIISWRRLVLLSPPPVHRKCCWLGAWSGAESHKLKFLLNEFVHSKTCSLPGSYATSFFLSDIFYTQVRQELKGSSKYKAHFGEGWHTHETKKILCVLIARPSFCAKVNIYFISSTHQ